MAIQKSSSFFFLLMLLLLPLYSMLLGASRRSNSASLKPHLSGNFTHDLLPLYSMLLGASRRSNSASLKPHLSGNLTHDLWFGIQLNPQFIGIDLKYDGLASCQPTTLSHEEYMTSIWDIIAERLGFMLVFGDLVWIPFTFSIQGWWLLRNNVELTTTAAIANCFIFLIGYMVFEELTSKSMCSKGIPKHLYGVILQKL
ncbi:hypothetical protein NL676_018068 [Syzygium grande]|nr:hypothetical protein NL676_018068 [Syzygium grande]